jgi:Tol biopolymer transport system component
MLIPALGGAERRVAEFDIQPVLIFAPSWLPDGTWLVVSARMGTAATNTLYRCSIDSGEMVRLTEPPPEAAHGDDSPAVAPDGRAIAFVRAGIFTFTHLYVLPISQEGKPAGPLKRIDTGAYSVQLAWTADNRGLIFSTVGVRANLVRIPADGSGNPVPLGLPEATQPAISGRGNRLVYAERRGDTNI